MEHDLLCLCGQCYHDAEPPTPTSSEDYPHSVTSKDWLNELREEFLEWKARGRTREQRYGVTNFLSGAGGKGIERILAAESQRARDELAIQVEELDLQWKPCHDENCENPSHCDLVNSYIMQFKKQLKGLRSLLRFPEDKK